MVTSARTASQRVHYAPVKVGPGSQSPTVNNGKVDLCGAGPSFKRGPPKGYIHAIEQRWHQVECLLGTIMAAPQAEGIISELRGDPFARTILDRVEAGPYGPRSRGREATNSESFYATIMGTSDNAAREDRRIRRQSRMTREIVSIEGIVASASSCGTSPYMSNS